MRAHAFLLGLAITLSAGCDRSESNSSAPSENGTSLRAETASVTGWHYTIRPDRIRDSVDHLARIANEDEDILRDRTMTLMVQKRATESLGIYFRGRMVGCPTVCTVAYRADGEVGSWIGARDDMGDDLTIREASEALDVIRRSRVLIVELPSEMGGQYTFRVAGLTWPPQMASDWPYQSNR